MPRTSALVLVVPYAAIQRLAGGGQFAVLDSFGDRKRRRAEAKRRKARRAAAKKRLEEKKANAPIHIKFIRGRWSVGRRVGWCAGYGGGSRPRRSRYRTIHSSRVGPRCGHTPQWDRAYAETFAQVTCVRCKELHAKDVERVRADVERAKKLLAEVEAGSLKKAKV